MSICPQPPHPPRDIINRTGTPRVRNSATAFIHPPPPTHTMAQHSPISPTWTKCLLRSRHCTECQPVVNKTGPLIQTGSQHPPQPTTHITAYSCTHTTHAHGTMCTQPVTDTHTDQTTPPQHSHRDTTGGSPHTSQPHTAPHEHPPLRDVGSGLPTHLRATSERESPHTMGGSQNRSQCHTPSYMEFSDSHTHEHFSSTPTVMGDTVLSTTTATWPHKGIYIHGP